MPRTIAGPVAPSELLARGLGKANISALGVILAETGNLGISTGLTFDGDTMTGIGRIRCQLTGN